MVDYSKLRDKSGTIYAGSRAFKDPTELGGYLGIPSHQIDWGRIQKQTATPADTKDWYLSPWTATGKGDWQQQPALRIGSNQYRFDTPQEYINKMQGLTGANAQTYINQFKTANIQWAYADKIVDFKLAAEAAGADTGRKSPVITDSNLYRMKNPTTNKIYLANAHQIAYYKDLGYQFYGKGKYTPVNITTGSQAIKAQPVQQTNNNNMKYKSLLQIYDERPDLQKAFPQKGTALDDWWNVHGKKEYPGVNLVQPGDSRLKTLTPTVSKPDPTPPAPTPTTAPLKEGKAFTSTYKPTLIEITSQRPDVLAEAHKHGGDPYTAGTGANTWLNDWYNRIGKAEGADMARRGLFGQPVLTGEVIDTGSETMPSIEVPDELASDPFFQQLDDDNKAMIAYYWSIQASQDEERIKKFETAMTIAGENAGTYWREKINIMVDEVKRSFGTLDKDVANREKELITRKQRLEEDLLYNKGQLGIEEQAELSRIKDEYDVQLENTRESMAAKGLSSSSIRNQAEERLSKRSGDMVGSSQRKYARELRSFTKTTERTKEDLERAVSELKERVKSSKVSTARSAEAYLGSERAGGEEDILKPHLLGGVSGQLVEDKSLDILQRAQNLMLSNY